MGWIVFCAICGGPTNDVPVAAKSRRAWLRQRPEKPKFEFPEDDYHEYFGYDPEVVSRRNIAWVHNLVLLGLNPDATGPSKAFMTGLSVHNDYALVVVQDHGHDPNLPENIHDLECYQIFWNHNRNTQVFPAYPLHPPCLDILRSVLTESPDKDLLYHVLNEDFGNSGSHLDLDYGNPNVDRACWGADAGEEVIVKSPCFDSTTTAFIQAKAATGKFAPSSNPPADLGSRVIRDPFASLPYDMMHEIALQLDPASIIALCNASSIINSTMTSTQGFWKRAVKTSMPWFWEAHDFIKVADGATTDFKRVFLWLDKSTRSAKNMEPSPFMNIANRRRIWHVCKQLEAPYRACTAAKAQERVAAVTELALTRQRTLS